MFNKFIRKYLNFISLIRFIILSTKEKNIVYNKQLIFKLFIKFCVSWTLYNLFYKRAIHQEYAALIKNLKINKENGIFITNNFLLNIFCLNNKNILKYDIVDIYLKNLYSCGFPDKQIIKDGDIFLILEQT